MNIHPGSHSEVVLLVESKWTAVKVLPNADVKQGSCVLDLVERELH